MVEIRVSERERKCVVGHGFLLFVTGFFFLIFFFEESIVLLKKMKTMPNLQKLLLTVSTCVAVAKGSHPMVEEIMRDSSSSLMLGAPKYILTILGDDYGWHNIGFHNNNITSPNMDDLAAHGVRLRRHYVFVWQEEGDLFVLPKNVCQIACENLSCASDDSLPVWLVGTNTVHQLGLACWYVLILFCFVLFRDTAGA